MALYKHVADNEDLLGGMDDVVVGGFWRRREAARRGRRSS
jgi:hypothetical protein